MGKSGLIGRKIAATLASCGTPADVHPSGRSGPRRPGHDPQGRRRSSPSPTAARRAEIVDLLDFIKRIGVKLIAITGDRHSRIANYSDIVLDARVEREAGPRGRRPDGQLDRGPCPGRRAGHRPDEERRASAKKTSPSSIPRASSGRSCSRSGMLMHNGGAIPRVPADAPMAAGDRGDDGQEARHDLRRRRGGQLFGIITDGDLRRMIEKIPGRRSSGRRRSSA